MEQAGPSLGGVSGVPVLPLLRAHATPCASPSSGGLSPAVTGEAAASFGGLYPLLAPAEKPKFKS